MVVANAMMPAHTPSSNVRTHCTSPAAIICSVSGAMSSSKSQRKAVRHTVTRQRQAVGLPCVCVCVREVVKEVEREGEKEGEKEGEREGEGV